MNTTNNITFSNAFLTEGRTINTNKSDASMVKIVRTLIFNRVAPHITFPSELVSMKHYTCADCGDKYIFKSSYDFHINRTVMNVTMFCKVCKAFMKFTNRCQVLSHIKSHADKMNTINLIDFRVDSLSPEDLILPSLVSETDDPPNDINDYLKILINGPNHLNTTPPNDVETLTKQFHELCDTALQECVDMSANGNYNPQSSHFYNEEYEQQIGNVSDSVKCTNDNLISTKNMKNKSVKYLKIPNKCLICGILITNKGVAGKRELWRHFQTSCNQNSSSMDTLKAVYHCKICILYFESKCAYVAHVAIHKKSIPYVCPECGFVLPTWSLFCEHLSYQCFHFARCITTKCTAKTCSTLIPIEKFEEHFTKYHTKSIFKCSNCAVACLKLDAIENHFQEHPNEFSEVESLTQCLECPYKLISENDISSHVRQVHDYSKTNTSSVFSCPGCEMILTKSMSIKRHVSRCELYLKSSCEKKATQNFVQSLLNPTFVSNNLGLFDIEQSQDTTEQFMTAPLENCHKHAETITDRNKGQKRHIDFNPLNTSLNITDDIEFTNFPNGEDNVQDVKSKKKRRTMNKQKPTNEKRSQFDSGVIVTEKTNDGDLICAKCSFVSTEKALFHNHILTHKDVSTAYQCMDCGLCFMVKSSLSNHLFIVHGIEDIDNYIKENGCVDEKAIEASKLGSMLQLPHVNKTVNENQCQICLEQFENKVDHDKHFRIHGMAFLLMKTKNKSPSSTV